MPNYEVLLADADGTLLDFDAAENKALAAACARMGLLIDEAQTARYKAINESLWRAFERREVTQSALRTLRFSRFFEELGVSLDPKEMAGHFVDALSLQSDELVGAREFLQKAASRVPVVVVTNGIASVQRSRFSRSPLQAFVSGYVISGEVGFAKPDPRMIHRALDIAGKEPSQALMLGDEPSSDIAAACAAGVASCWFNPTGRQNPTPHRPTYEIRELKEALQWL